MKLPEPKKLPSGNWHIMLRLGGQTQSVTRPTKTECVAAARLIKSEYLAGKKLKSKSDSTLDDIMKKFIDSRRKVLSPSTLNGYECIRKNRFQNYLKKKPSEIKNWQNLIDSEIEDGVKAKTVKNSWALLASALAYEGEDVPKVTLPKIMPAVRPWLDADQVKIFVKAVHGHPVEIPALLALHSLRRSEILGLTWENIDLKQKTIRIVETAVIGEGNKLVQKKSTKSRKGSRTVPIMIPELESALAAVPEDKRKGQLYDKTPTLIWEQVNLICKRNGLPEVGVHGLRHSFCSLAHHVGMSEAETMLLGGWEDVGTMRKIYQHISDADRLKAENKLTSFFQNAYENAHETEKAQ